VTLCWSVQNLGKINLVVSDQLEKDFREAVFRKFGMKKGNITKATEEALVDWITKSKLP